MKRKAFLNRAVAIFPHTRKVRLTPYPASCRLGEWTPQHVCILRDDGGVVQERLEPRKSFGILKQFRWDSLDLLYFAGYALWNYLSFPFLLTEPGVEVQESSTGRNGQRRRLYATFPAGFPTHCGSRRFLSVMMGAYCGTTTWQR
jgi:hypothetical protein